MYRASLYDSRGLLYSEIKVSADHSSKYIIALNV